MHLFTELRCLIQQHLLISEILEQEIQQEDKYWNLDLHLGLLCLSFAVVYVLSYKFIASPLQIKHNRILFQEFSCRNWII